MSTARSVRDPRIAQVTSASLSDAVDRRYSQRSCVLGLVSPTPERVLFGRALTLRFVPRRNDVYDPQRHNFARLFYEALGEDAAAGAGRVLVLSSAGREDVSLGGGIKLARAAHHGLAGVIADGRLRDFDELGAQGIAVWCRGPTPRGGQHDLMPIEANVPVTLADATVLPGDYIYADRAGAVIIPAAALDAVLDDAVAIEARDRESAAGVRGEDPARVRREGRQDD
ncbi:MAG TPA: RraA family protein [Acidiferrobacterales bacterium]